MAVIQNVPLYAIKSGEHFKSENSILIQIVDPDMEFPIPVHPFNSIHQFKFLDVEATDLEYGRITQGQAKEIVSVLKAALDNNQDVIVHCVMGVCRSGAVAEIGTMMGFRDTGVYRQPNLLVKSLMMKELGWSYDND